MRRPSPFTTAVLGFACLSIVCPASQVAAAAKKKAPPPAAAKAPPAPPPEPVLPPPTQASFEEYSCKAVKKNVVGAAVGILSKGKKWVLGDYTVDGRKGKFICQVDMAKLDKIYLNDPEARATFSANHRGEYQDRQINMPATTAKLQYMVDTIAAQWPGPKPAYVPVRIAGTSVYQAEALPDNSIKVHMGLLIQARTEDEVAFILAHEYAHIVLGHLKRNDTLQKQNKLISTLSDSYYYGVKISQQEWNEVGKKLVIKDPDAVVDAQQEATDTSQQLHMILDVLVTPVWKRSQEDQADTLGFDLASKAGYNVSSAAGVAFQTMAASEGEQKSIAQQLTGDLEASLKSAAEKQAQALNALAAEGKLTSEAVDEAGNNLWKGFNRSLREKVLETFRKFLTRTHRKPEDRIEGLDLYATAAYGEGGDILKTPKWLAATRETREYKDAAIAVAAVEASMKARLANDIPTAYAEISKAAKTIYVETPMVLNELARVQVRQKNYAAADATFNRAHKLPGQSVEAYLDHVDLLMRIQKWGMAKAKAETAIKLFQDEKPFLPSLVAIAFASGEEDQGVAKLKACIALEVAQLKQACVNASPYPEDPIFKRMTAANQEAVILARNKVNDKNTVNQASNALSSFLSGFKDDEKDDS